MSVTEQPRPQPKSYPPPTGFLVIEQVIDLTTLSRARIYDQMNKGLFPQSVKGVGGRKRSTVWVAAEIYSYIEQQIHNARGIQDAHADRQPHAAQSP
jgi:predicted DNA-binding transcriptional regulator AlpA